MKWICKANKYVNNKIRIKFTKKKVYITNLILPEIWKIYISFLIYAEVFFWFLSWKFILKNKMLKSYAKKLFNQHKWFQTHENSKVLHELEDIDWHI